jgi:UDP-N-acetylmuramoylalanine--D-glutamate ligase
MKIAIAGYGVEGEANYRYYNTPDNQVVIIDEKQPSHQPPVDASLIIGDDAFARLNGYDMVVRTAGLAPRKITTDGKIWSATNEFFANCPAPIIGVTGSKGKGTTSSLIAGILSAAGKTIHLVGNIGVPALDILPTIQPDDIVVYELSSFQLWDLEKSPQIAVVLMIEADHLDVHADMAEYVTAKSQIVRHQTAGDLTVYNASNRYATSIAELTIGDKIGYQSPETAHVKDDYFWYGEQKLCSTDTLQLPGGHNLDNACAAINAVWRFTQDASVIASGLAAFTGLPHRLKFVRSVAGVAYYDDSIATTPGSSIAAVRAFTQPKVLIVGGSDKGADYTPLVLEIMANDSIRAVIAIGEQGPAIAGLLTEAGAHVAVHVLDTKDMHTIVAHSAACAQSGDVVILSPACASFDMFKSYADRGDQFIAAVNELS